MMAPPTGAQRPSIRTTKITKGHERALGLAAAAFVPFVSFVVPNDCGFAAYRP